MSHFTDKITRSIHGGQGKISPNREESSGMGRRRRWISWFRAATGPEDRRRLNLFRVARLIECDIGFLLALRPSSWYPTAERRGKFKTRHASTTLHSLPLYFEWTWSKRASSLCSPLLRNVDLNEDPAENNSLSILCLCCWYFYTREIVDCEIFTNLKLAFIVVMTLGTFPQINSISDKQANRINANRINRINDSFKLLQLITHWSMCKWSIR